jgi:hypothetical protein
MDDSFSAEAQPLDDSLENTRSIAASQAPSHSSDQSFNDGPPPLTQTFSQVMATPASTYVPTQIVNPVHNEEEEVPSELTEIVSPAAPTPRATRASTRSTPAPISQQSKSRTASAPRATATPTQRLPRPRPANNASNDAGTSRSRSTPRRSVTPGSSRRMDGQQVLEGIAEETRRMYPQLPPNEREQQDRVRDLNRYVTDER